MERLQSPIIRRQQIRGGRKQDFIRNLLKRLKTLLRNYQGPTIAFVLNFEKMTKPNGWTAITQLFYFYLLFHQASQPEATLFKNLILAQLDKNIDTGRGALYTPDNKKLLEFFKKIALNVFNKKKTMPLAIEVNFILSRLHGSNQPQTTNQEWLIEVGVKYIFNNFPKYYSQYISPKRIIYKKYVFSTSIQDLFYAELENKEPDPLDDFSSENYTPESPEERTPKPFSNQIGQDILCLFQMNKQIFSLSS